MSEEEPIPFKKFEDYVSTINPSVGYLDGIPLSSVGSMSPQSNRAKETTEDSVFDIGDFHDGKFDDGAGIHKATVEIQEDYELWDGSKLVEICGGHGDRENCRILLDPKQFLELLKWGEQERPNLEKLAYGQLAKGDTALVDDPLSKEEWSDTGRRIHDQAIAGVILKASDYPHLNLPTTKGRTDEY
jgi:hypothetical protein